MSDKIALARLTAQISEAWVSNPKTRPDNSMISTVIATVGNTLAQTLACKAQATLDQPSTEHVPAVTVQKSLRSRDFIISMIDGKPYKTLKRHLARHGLTPDEYRARYNLKPDYPMTAPTFREQRSAQSRQMWVNRQKEPVTPPAQQQQGPRTKGRRKLSIPEPA